MAASNDSQGLKIAVAVFVTLTVLMAVSTYFGYRAYTEADAKRAKAESDAGKANTAASEALNRYDEMRKEIGARAEELDSVKLEIKKEYTKIDEELKAMVDGVNDAVAKAQAAGAQGPELQESKDAVQRIVADYRNEPNKTYISALARMTNLLKDMSALSTRVALNYVDVKRNLESSVSVNNLKLQEQVKAADDAKSDLASEHQKHEESRSDLLTRLDRFQTENNTLVARIANLEAKLRQTEDDYSRRLSTAQNTVREYRDRLEREENVLDRPDGYVTYVDYNRGEVQANLTRSMGARPQMVFSIFDKNAPGIPTDKPKGAIELISVNDQFSIAKIVKTNSNIDPISEGDIVYSAAWSPNEPMRFALIGKIDMNRDGKDDREDLKRMITAAGGIVDYDLPPLDAGKETGKLTGRDAWYVIDERRPFRDVYSKTNVTELQNQDFLNRQTAAIREARLNGVRPMPIERLLPFLGYDFHAPIMGRAEAVNTSALKRVLSPRQNGDGNPGSNPANGDQEMPREER